MGLPFSDTAFGCALIRLGEGVACWGAQDDFDQLPKCSHLVVRSCGHEPLSCRRGTHNSFSGDVPPFFCPNAPSGGAG